MKKVLKTIVILILIIVMIISINISVNAEEEQENIKVTLQPKGKVELIQGNMIEIAIDLQLLNEEKVNGVQLLIKYDQEILRLNEEDSFIVTRDTRWDYPTTSDYNGEIGLVTTRDETKGDLSGEVCNIVFEVLETTDNINIEMEEIYCSFVEKLIEVEDYTLNIKTETPDENPGENPGGDSGENPGGDSGENPGGDSGENPGGDSGENPGGDSGENPGEKPDENPEEKLYLSTDIYKIGEENIQDYEDGDKYISRVEKETTKENFINSLKTNGEIKILKHDGTELSENELVGTGMTIEVTKDEEKITMKIAVMGDLSGDGKITATDLSTLNQTILKTVTLENEYKIAGDLDENENITATDLSTLNKMLLKLL